MLLLRKAIALLAVGYASICIPLAAQAQLTAAFGATTPRSGCSPLVVSFGDSSAGNPTQWRWDLGNGVISSLRNPSTTYFNPGTYAVKLVVRNAAGNADSLTKASYVTVFASPAASFSADKTSGCFPLPVQFTDISTAGSGSLMQWLWDFGDGTTSTQQHPRHTYSSAGNFSVTLRVTNSFGCVHTFTRSQYIAVAAGVTAGFSQSGAEGCPAPAIITFTNTSTGPAPLSYQWNFGDGGASTVQNPVYAYNANGSYDVMLVVSSAAGCTDTLRRPGLVQLGTVKAAFDAPDTVCVGTAVSLTNTSSPTPLSNLWSFGNGVTSVDANPSISYTTPGNYTIRLVSQFGGCVDSARHTIHVSALPQPSFTIANNNHCSVPASVAFTNTTSGGGTAAWDFGDGATSSTFSPTHTYTAQGSYAVSLTITNSGGCSQTITQPAAVNIQLPQVIINNLPRNGCAPITITPTATVTSSHSIASYQWSFGDGGSSASATPTHTYTNTGTYSVKLVYTTTNGCTDSVVMPNAVRVGTKPHAAFTLAPPNACAFQSVQFTDLTADSVDQWEWNFGDGTISGQQHPAHEYSDTGWFDVQLVVYNNTCPDTVRLTNAVHIKPPIAVFTVAHSCTDKYTKTFTNASIGATTWLWQFGDGQTSTAQHPTHTYAATGVYTVRLTVTNDTCSHTVTQTVRVIDEKAAFTASDSLVCRNATDNFTSAGITAANIASWQWAFGDGATSTTTSSTTHAYTTSGNYTVQLTITDLLGCADDTSLPVRVYGPRADFMPSASVSCLDSNRIVFTDASTTDGIHPLTSWIWNYGDGTTDSTGIHPFIHSYAAAGNYTVTLIVLDSFGCSDMAASSLPIIIAQPVAGFYSADSLTCTGRPIHFTNTSAGNGLQQHWTFGDGQSSAVQHPVHNYAAIGSYDISLAVIDQYGCTDTLSRPAYINISYPEARFAVSDSVSTCPPLLVNFSSQSTGYTTLHWDFGDGTSSSLDSPSHFYTTPGVFNAVLIATGPGGCSDTAMKRIEIRGPSGSFTYAPLTGCTPLMVNFTATAQNNATYTWDFADGNIAVTADSVISHTYVNAGDFIPKMILTDAGGCSVPITGADTITATGVVAGFSLSAADFCQRGTVQFTNTTVGNDFIAGYQWDFGDGNTSTSQHPSHHYAAPGIYSVSLAVTSQKGCRDSITLTDTVKVWANPIITIVADTAGCTPVTVRPHGAIALGDSTTLLWNWNLGNGQSATVQHPSAQVYNMTGAYFISTIATDNHGCADTASTTVNVYPIPVVYAGADAWVCRGSFATLQATGADTYLWQAQPSLSCTACAGPLAAPADSTLYHVSGTTVHGCSSTDSVMLRVHQPFTLRVGAGDTVCAGEPVRLQATGADKYTWIPATAVAAPTTGTTTAIPMTTTTYAVVARDNHDCFADTGYLHIKVWPIPTVDAGADQVVPIGSTVTLSPAYSADITRYQWNNPMQSLSCTDCPAPVMKTRAQKMTCTIRVENEGGCASNDEVTINTICNGANLFIPNTFSPNSDGRNERFYTRGSGLNRIKSLRIYNRWGETVFVAAEFQANDASAGWDGSFRGKPLPPDVYVYTCEVVCGNNEVLTYHGNVTLLR